MQLFFHSSIADKVTLDEIESHHCIRVLRHKAGDQIHIIDGKGKLYKGIVSKENQKKCEINEIILEKDEPRSSNLHIAIAPTKNADRMEWFFEKATEIGLKEVTPILCTNSERPRINIDRMNKKAVGAIKQNQSLWLPGINPLVSFEEFITHKRSANKFIAFVEDNDQAQKLSDIHTEPEQEIVVLIGPEGDFTHEEVQVAIRAGYQMVNLGKNVLRTETAGVVVCALLAT